MPFITPGVTRSQEMTLDRCIQLSLKQNPGLKRIELERNIDRSAKLAAWGQFMPSMRVGYGIDQSESTTKTYVHDSGTVVELPEAVVTKRRNSDYTIAVDETVFDGGRNYLNLRNTQLQETVRNRMIDSQVFAVRSLATSAFCQVAASWQRKELSEEILIQRRRQLEYAAIRFKTGSVTRRDVMQAEVDLGRAKNDNLETALDLREALNALNLVLGFPVDTTYIPANLPDMFKPSWSLDSLLDLALTNRPDITTASKNLEILQNTNLALKGDYLPRVDASYRHTRSERSGGSESFTFSPRNRYSSVNLTFSWLLFDRFSRSLQLQYSEIKIRQTAIDKNELDKEIYRQVAATLDRLNSLHDQNLVAVKNTALAFETMQFEEERYRLGSATTIDVGAAQVSYIQARNDEIFLKSEFFRVLGELEKATATELR